MDKEPTLDNPEFVAALDAELETNLKELERPNRRQRRKQAKAMRRLTVRADAGIKRFQHPLLPWLLLPYGRKEMERRRAAGKRQRQARRANRG